MDNLNIKLFPNPVLTKQCQKVTDFNQDLANLAKEMVKAMRNARGVGLAAPQVGKNIKLVVIEHRAEDGEDYEDIPLQILVNPKIISFSKETDVKKEGCLSIPSIEIPVERSRKIKVMAQNELGEKIQFRASDFKARIIQHELDHLNGVLILDYAKNKDQVIENYLAKQKKIVGSPHNDQDL